MIRCLLLAVAPVILFAQTGVKELEYIDHYDRSMTTYQQWAAGISAEPVRHGTVYNTSLV